MARKVLVKWVSTSALFVCLAASAAPAPAPWADRGPITMPSGYGETYAWGRAFVGGISVGTLPAPPIYIVDAGVGRHQDLNIARDIIVTPGVLPVGCQGHATHLAGIIGARFRNGGVAGVLAGAPLISVQIATANRSIGGQPVCAESALSETAIANGLQKVYEDIWPTTRAKRLL